MNGLLTKRKAVRVVPVILAVTVSLAATAGCGGRKAKRAESFARAQAGDIVIVEGTLTLRGSQPHTLLVLETQSGEDVVIQSGDIQRELKRLAGMKVSVEGKVLPSIDGETPLVSAVAYELLALPSGEVPVVGVLTVVDGACVLGLADGTRYWIRGEFSDLIRDFANAKMWVVGTVGDAALPEKPEGTVPIWVTGYGVLSER
jgi:hypothetical protein